LQAGGRRGRREHEQHANSGQRGAVTRRHAHRRAGRLGQIIRAAFPTLQAQAEGGDTELSGILADQAALYGVLAEAEALGLELIEVRRLPG
jgi:hypothetical protein